ncbi:hypothetical protein [Parabacteroides sp. ZJ-118]|uniref:hypothetical protein n=1 Tax=Parabacteroides sp. ZJ-118 TaxID=2709398 RepID=UPI00197E8A04|nr:hypothetical protein [Parabacteroides sp. ZJ-118]
MSGESPNLVSQKAQVILDRHGESNNKIRETHPFRWNIFSYGAYSTAMKRNIRIVVHLPDAGGRKIYFSTDSEMTGRDIIEFTNHGNKATKAIMTECAWCTTRAKGTYFSTRYKRLASRRGKKRALVAIAAEMLKVVYHILKDGSAYKELGENYMVSRRKDAQIKYHREQLNRLLGEDSPETQSA